MRVDLTKAINDAHLARQYLTDPELHYNLDILDAYLTAVEMAMEAQGVDRDKQRGVLDTLIQGGMLSSRMLNLQKQAASEVPPINAEQLRRDLQSQTLGHQGQREGG